jgi:NAD(P)-dependent dehydrogenase (short-subunit alcohol dehydrogenase family)
MSNSVFGLEGKNALVIGGGQGMGESTVMQLANAGANVTVLDLDLSRAEAVAAKVKALGRKSWAVSADVLNDAALKAVIAKADADMGGIDAMASIIGMAGWSRLVDMTEEFWDMDQNRNVRYFFIAAREVAKTMLKRKKPGSIVCITSIDGVRSAPYHASYGAAKAGLVSLVKSMSIEWGEAGIRVNAVAPGAIVTPRIPEGDVARERAMTQGVPMHRRGTTDDIGKAALFFLSAQSSYVTGQTLAVDGGYLAAALLDYEAIINSMQPGGTLGVK